MTIAARCLFTRENEALIVRSYIVQDILVASRNCSERLGGGGMRLIFGYVAVAIINKQCKSNWEGVNR